MVLLLAPIVLLRQNNVTIVMCGSVVKRLE